MEQQGLVTMTEFFPDFQHYGLDIEGYGDFADTVAQIFSEQSSVEVYVVLGCDVPERTTWNRVEFPALMHNQDMKMIISFDEDDLKCRTRGFSGAGCTTRRDRYHPPLHLPLRILRTTAVTSLGRGKGCIDIGLSGSRLSKVLLLHYSGFEPYNSMAIFAAGPVGLLAAYSVSYAPRSIQSVLGKPYSVASRASCCDCQCDTESRKLILSWDIVLHNTIAIPRVYGGMGVAGVYPSTAYSADGGQPDRLLRSGVASSDFIVSSVVGVEDAPEAYRRYHEHLEAQV
ncbi:hypothetical protein BBP40_003800 [Aspergillus hancockii]|nr:hypothetical protein BBP40_003800 [Aspergillus hancockii]